MARVCYPEHILHIHGLASKKKGKVVYKFFKPSNKIYLSARPEGYKDPTPAMIAQQTKFSQASAQVKTIMADQQQLAPYKTAFANQHKYVTLRGYIFAQVMATL